MIPSWDFIRKIIIKTKKKLLKIKLKIKDYLNSKNLYLAFIENKENKLVINANTYLLFKQIYMRKKLKKLSKII